MIEGIVKRLFRKSVANFLIPDIKISYSQFGEDMIMSYLFYELKIAKPSYLDIGANHPRFISNTYYFYEHGSRGVCVEPNSVLCDRFKKIRPFDKVLNVGIGLNEMPQADFYQFPYHAHGLSTFSHNEAIHWKEIGMEGIGKIDYEKVIKIPMVNINTVMEKYFQNPPDLLTIDVEGLDLEILSSLDFNKFKPKVICAETLMYNNDRKGLKNQSIIDLLLSRGYFVYADTRVNTIFCLNDLI